MALALFLFYTRGTRQKTLLVVSQVYVPEPAAVSQHMTDAAVEMSI